MEQNEKSGKLLEVKDLRVSFFTPRAPAFRRCTT